MGLLLLIDVLAPLIEAFSALAGVFIAFVGLVVTGVLVWITARTMNANRVMAEANVAMVQEMIANRNLLERQLHRPSIEQIRQATNVLFNDANGGDVRKLLRDTEAVLMDRAPSLPQELFDRLKKAIFLSHAVGWGTAGSALSNAELVELGQVLALSIQNTIDAYLRRPGRPIREMDIPSDKDDLKRWLVEKAERDAAFDDQRSSSNRSADA